VQGSGPGGRIVRRDIEALLERQAQDRGAPAAATTAVAEPAPPPAEPDQARAEPAPAPPRPAPHPQPRSQPSAVLRAVRRIPQTRMRKTIAQRMVQAKQSAPEIHLTVDIRVDRLVAAREPLNQRLAAEGIKLSLGDFVTKAVALALRAHPG